MTQLYSQKYTHRPKRPQKALVGFYIAQGYIRRPLALAGGVLERTISTMQVTRTTFWTLPPFMQPPPRGTCRRLCPPRATSQSAYLSFLGSQCRLQQPLVGLCRHLPPIATSQRATSQRTLPPSIPPEPPPKGACRRLYPEPPPRGPCRRLYPPSGYFPERLSVFSKEPTQVTTTTLSPPRAPVCLF